MSKDRLQDRVRERVRAARIDRGMTQEQLAEAAGISLDAVSRIEGGSRVPGLDTVGKLADALGLTVSDLVALSPVPPPRHAAPVMRLVRLLDAEPPHVQRAAEALVATLVRAAGTNVTKASANKSGGKRGRRRPR